MKAIVKRYTDVNVWDYNAKPKKVWGIFNADDTSELFAKYPTKKAALEDAKRYGITILK